MASSAIGRVFENGGSQAVRLPSAFRIKGDRVRLRKVEGGILLQPIISHAGDWFGYLDEVQADLKDRKPKVRLR